MSKNIDNMTEEYKKIREKYSSLRMELREKQNALYRDEQEELAKLVNFKDKYLIISGGLYDDKYLYVDEQFNHQDISTKEPVIVLRGQGFNYCFTIYSDDTYAFWNQFCSHEIKIDNLDQELRNIKEISKEEYNEAFEKMIEGMIIEHKNYFNDVDK
jgi:hypothetical protein